MGSTKLWSGCLIGIKGKAGKIQRALALSLLPDGRVPGCHAPDGHVPDGHAPGGHVPEGHIPDGHTPHGHVSDGCVPDGHVLGGHASDGCVPGGHVPISPSQPPHQDTLKPLHL